VSFGDDCEALGQAYARFARMIDVVHGKGFCLPQWGL